MSNRSNPSAFLSIQEVDALVDRALAKDRTLPPEAFAWVVGFGEARYVADTYVADKIRDYVYSRWPEFSTRGRMASGRRTNNIIEKLREVARPHWISNRPNAEATADHDTASRVWAVAVGHDIVAYVNGGSKESAVAEAEVTWRWLYPSQSFSAFLVGLGGKRESDVRNGKLMLGMHTRVNSLRESAANALNRAERLETLLNTWAVTNPEQLQSALAAG